MSRAPSHLLRPTIGALVSVLLACWLFAAAAHAEEEAAEGRPSDIPYDTPGEIPQLSPKYKLSDHELVLITDQSLNPRLVTLSEGQLVAWISYSASPSVVVFERETARSMVCHSLVNFSIIEDELRSAPIQAGEFASFCELKPGRYRYKVIRPDPLGGGVDAARRLEGVIVVGNPESTEG